MQRGSTLEKTVKSMNSLVAIEERRSNTSGGMRQATFVRDGTIIDLF